MHRPQNGAGHQREQQQEDPSFVAVAAKAQQPGEGHEQIDEPHQRQLQRQRLHRIVALHVPAHARKEGGAQQRPGGIGRHIERRAEPVQREQLGRFDQATQPRPQQQHMAPVGGRAAWAGELEDETKGHEHEHVHHQIRPAPYGRESVRRLRLEAKRCERDDGRRQGQIAEDRPPQAQGGKVRRPSESGACSRRRRLVGRFGGAHG